MNLRQAVAFGILMSTDVGVLGKSPRYIREKVASCGSLPVPETILDRQGRAVMKLFAEKWNLNWNWEEDIKNMMNAEVNPETGELIVKEDSK